MVRTPRITVDTNVDRVRNDLGKFMSGIPSMEDDEARELAESLEGAVKESVRDKFDSFSGELYNNVEARRSGGGTEGASWQVTANAYSQSGVNYAAWHEFAEQSHFVPLRDSSGQPTNAPIGKWARQHGLTGISGVEVTPINQQEGSFMAPAVREAISKRRKRRRSNRTPTQINLAKFFDA